MRLEIDGIVAALPDGMRLIVHVGHNSPAEARRLASHAEEAGAEAIAAFFRPLREPAE